LPLILRSAALVFLVLAVCRPQTYNMSEEVKTPGVDIVMCLDISGSMKGMDFTLDGKPVDRITVVKKVASDFIRRREYDRICLIPFGTHPYTMCPLTQDKGLLLSLVSKIDVIPGNEMTAIGEALALAGKRLKDIKSPSKIVILLTDGRQTCGDIAPVEAASALSALGIKIYAIGVGTKGPVPFRVRGMFGEQTVTETADLDDETLKQVAATGNGRFFLASDTKTLAEIYDQIDRAEKTEVKVKQFFHFKEHYAFFLAVALLLLTLETALGRLRALP
jgi:Ca-activated chloride channel family protein